jgi:hypothetical protein
VFIMAAETLDENFEELFALGVRETTVANDVLNLLKASAGPAVANHSLRSFLFARLLAEHRGALPDQDYDPDLLFYACALHDIGTTDAASGSERFEVAGADMVARFLTDRALEADDVDTVWEAIALNTSGGIAERRGPICELTRLGVVIDFGRGTEFIPDETAAEIHRQYPRLDLASAIFEAIATQAQATPSKAPAFSMAAEFVRERAAGEKTFETESNAIRWSVYA